MSSGMLVTKPLISTCMPAGYGLHAWTEAGHGARWVQLQERSVPCACMLAAPDCKQYLHVHALTCCPGFSITEACAAVST